jgi:hypothetical protein
MKYKVNLSYPTAIVIEGVSYMLFPGQEVELPENSELTKTYEGLGYITPIEENKTKKVKGGNSDAS